MNTSLKAVLLSAFVYPGAGHLSVKKYLSAIVFASIFSVALWFVITELIDITEQVLEEIKFRGSLDIPTISEAVLSIGSDLSREVNIASYVMIVVWVVSIVDAYRVSREQKR